jgi:hypothetical protein
MKLIALVTIEPGSVPPGGVIDIKDKAEAESLVARGLAALPPKAPAPADPPPPPAPTPVAPPSDPDPK